MQQVSSVLIVEDDYALNDAFSMILRHAGYNVRSASNGEAALQLLADGYSPDIILLDILMPVMDGRIFLSRYKNPRKIPVVALSNLDAREEIDQILALGATNYMLKSNVNPVSLVSLVQSELAP